MDDAVLKNSQGATYKSFILDIEIVLKKEGVRGNVAESKIKEDSQVPKGKDKTKGTGESPGAAGKNAPTGRSGESATVYIAATGPHNIFTEQSRSVKQDSEADNKANVSKVDKFSYSNEMALEGKNPQYQVETAEKLKEKQLKKYRKQKKRHTGKASRGKVEAIDFLECNRIFMCNYLHIPDHNLYTNNATSYGDTIANTFVHNEFQNVNLKCLEPKRKYRFWRKNRSKYTISPKVKLIYEGSYSSGDCKTRGVFTIYQTDIEHNTKMNMYNYENNVPMNFHNNIVSQCFHNIALHQRRAIFNTKPLFRMTSNTDGRNFCASKGYEHNDISPPKVELRKSQSLPNINHVQFIVNANRNEFRKIISRKQSKVLVIDEDCVSSTNNLEDTREFPIVTREGSAHTGMSFCNIAHKLMVPFMKIGAHETDVNCIYENTCFCLKKVASADVIVDTRKQITVYKTQTLEKHAINGKHQGNQCCIANKERKQAEKCFTESPKPKRCVKKILSDLFTCVSDGR